MSRRAEGSRWERRAEAWLKRQGLRPVARNVTFRGGEIDLVMRDGEAVVFVEVRSRREDAMVGALESIGAVKRQRLIRAAQMYLSSEPALARHPCRFDVVAITTGGWRTRIEWVRQAFST